MSADSLESLRREVGWTDASGVSLITANDSHSHTSTLSSNLSEDFSSVQATDKKPESSTTSQTSTDDEMYESSENDEEPRRNSDSMAVEELEQESNLDEFPVSSLGHQHLFFNTGVSSSRVEQHQEEPSLIADPETQEDNPWHPQTSPPDLLLPILEEDPFSDEHAIPDYNSDLTGPEKLLAQGYHNVEQDSWTPHSNTPGSSRALTPQREIVLDFGDRMDNVPRRETVGQRQITDAIQPKKKVAQIWIQPDWRNIRRRIAQRICCGRRTRKVEDEEEGVEYELRSTLRRLV
ncbi:hypothetical protein V8E51_007701 [Hyaloscypha variabilis]